ncbi:MAG: hypothetical protein KDC61_14265 [Saprospiraceae bacterium]|nr:hypothetical protein [Saprospiraceae bacterium]MCB0575719.1 hypothetical protein [Saprospiraceae bacterium]
MNETLYNLLRQYQSGQLSAEEKTAFEKRLSEDPSFATEAGEYATCLLAIHEEGDRLLSDKLSVYAKNLSEMNATPISLEQTKVKTHRISTYTRLAYLAAAIFVLFVVALPLWLADGSTHPEAESTDEMFAANFSIPPAPEARDDDATPWRTAYGKGDYPGAIQNLEVLLADPAFKGRSEANHYLGVSYLAIGKPAKALNALTKVSPDSYDWESAQWYSALSLIKLGRTEDATSLLSEIAGQASHPQQKQAKKMLETLK